MYELTLSTTVDKQLYTSELFKNLTSDIRQDAGVIVKQNNNGRSYLAIAINENKKEYYQSKILDYISFMILDDYKYNYFKERLNENNSSIVYNAFLRAITIFDSESDKDIIKSQIQLSGDVLIDSFFYFRLSILRLKWEKAIAVINGNGVTNETQTMIDVLRYLIKVSGNILYVADIQITNKQILFKDYKQTKKYKYNFQGISTFLADLIKNNPAKINIKNNTHKDTTDILEVLNQLFEDKIYLIS